MRAPGSRRLAVRRDWRRTIERAWYRFLHLPPRLLYALGGGALIGRFVLLLTTRGRRSGASRTTPLQYERVGSAVIVGSARGIAADWYRNVDADARVEVTVGRRHFRGRATPNRDPTAVADFLELRLTRHPRLVGAILRLAGLPARPSRTKLEAYAQGLAIVTIEPDRPGEPP